MLMVNQFLHSTLNLFIMRKFTLMIVGAMALILVSFTVNFTGKTTTVLDDIDGTLLKSPAVIENNDGQFSVTFSVDQNVIVTNALIGESNEIFLLENGRSDVAKTVTLDLQPVNGKVATAFNNIYERNYDVATIGGLSVAKDPDKRPAGIIIWE